MNVTETTQIVARIALADNRKVDAAVIRHWHDLIGDLEFPDALDAVRDHYKSSDAYLMPVHIVGRVKAARAKRIPPEGQILAEMTRDGIDPDDPRWTLEYRARRMRYASCLPASIVLPIGGTAAVAS